MRFKLLNFKIAITNQKISQGRIIMHEEQKINEQNLNTIFLETIFHRMNDEEFSTIAKLCISNNKLFYKTIINKILVEQKNFINYLKNNN